VPVARERSFYVPIEQVNHEAVLAFDLGEDGAGLGASEDDGQFGRTADALDPGDVLELSIEDLLVEKKEGAKGLVLGGGGDATFDSEMAKEEGDLGFAHLFGVPLAVEEDEAANPIEVSLLGPNAVMLNAQMPADAVQ
jgi:hypothetical protein